MSNYATIESSIVSRLQSIHTALPEVSIVPMPETEAEFARPAGGAARITVACNSSESDDLKAVDMVIQDAIHTVVVVIQSPKLRGNKGIYALERLVRLSLIGFKPTDCRAPMKFKTSQLYQPGEKLQDVWTFQMEFIAVGVYSQLEPLPDELLSEALIKQITIVPNIGEPSVTTDDEVDGGGAADVGFDLEIDGNV